MRIDTILVTAVVNAVVVGVLVFSFQKYTERRMNRSFEEFKAALQQETFVRQAWWERKAQAYSEIIASLVDMQYCLRQWLSDVVGYEALDTESKEKTEEVYVQQKEGLAKVTATGAYIVSEDTIATLERLLRDLEMETPDVFETVNIHHNIVKEAIAKVREHARVELHKPA